MIKITQIASNIAKFSKQTPKFQFCQTSDDANNDVWDHSLKHSKKSEVRSLEAILEKYIPEKELKEAKRIIYGKPVNELQISHKAHELAKDLGIELKAYKVDCPKEQLRDPRLVRVGVIQNRIQSAPSSPIAEQKQSLIDWMQQAVKVAHEAGVNVLCTQELWCGPFFPATRETYPWLEFAEDIETGSTTKMFQTLAKQYNMVIVNSQLERDQAGRIWNTCAFINNKGEYMGMHRKNHIPRVGDFNESTYYMESNTGHPVFETQFGKIAANICYGRHFPQNWMMFGLNGAEIIFNPSATIGDLSEPLWPIEARNAAIANHAFTVGINRVGTEQYPNEFSSGDANPAHKDFGMFYGSSYLACPDGSRTPGLSRIDEGLLVTEIDLNMCQQVQDKWKFRMCGRYELYEESLKNFNQPNYKPQIIKKE